jgi:hypothetical protein
MTPAIPDGYEIVPEGTKAALSAYIAAYPHFAPHDCFATGPHTGDPIMDLVACPGCNAKRLGEIATQKDTPNAQG